MASESDGTAARGEDGAPDSGEPMARADPILDFSALHEAISAFVARFDRYVQTTLATVDEARIADDAQHAEEAERTRALERQREELKPVASERAADTKLRASVQALHAQSASLVQRTSDVQGEVAEMRAHVEQRRQHKQEQIRHLRQQVQRNAPELAHLEALTGCAIVPSQREGTIDFVFSLLDPAAPQRRYTLSVDASKDRYAIAKHDGALSASDAQALVRQLNKTEDFNAFIKAARAAMQRGVAKAE
ncbi:kinetochore-associated Ndc80 complex subunit spc25 [Malassezia sp. CBS 17886]|nr:kinetochore-associated Ndc80 complex subunit spc25 [Malassezia sp. CBS 17886]